MLLDRFSGIWSQLLSLQGGRKRGTAYVLFGAAAGRPREALINREC